MNQRARLEIQIYSVMMVKFPHSILFNSRIEEGRCPRVTSFCSVARPISSLSLYPPMSRPAPAHRTTSTHSQSCENQLCICRSYRFQSSVQPDILQILKTSTEVSSVRQRPSTASRRACSSARLNPDSVDVPREGGSHQPTHLRGAHSSLGFSSFGLLCILCVLKKSFLKFVPLFHLLPWGHWSVATLFF